MAWSGGGGILDNPTMRMQSGLQPTYVVHRVGNVLYAKSTVAGLPDDLDVDLGALHNRIRGVYAIYFKKGIYPYYTPLNPVGGETLEGEGMGTEATPSTIFTAAADVDCIQLLNPAVQSNRIAVRDLAIKGFGAQATGYGICLSSNNVDIDQCQLNNLLITECYTGIRLLKAPHTVLVNVKSNHHLHTGIEMFSGSFQNTLYACSGAYNGYRGISIDASNMINCYGCVAEANVGAGLIWAGSSNVFSFLWDGGFISQDGSATDVAIQIGSGAGGIAYGAVVQNTYISHNGHAGVLSYHSVGTRIKSVVFAKTGAGNDIWIADTSGVDTIINGNVPSAAATFLTDAGVRTRITENPNYNPRGNIATPWINGAGNLSDAAAALDNPVSDALYTVTQSPKLVVISNCAGISAVQIDGVTLTNMTTQDPQIYYLNPGQTIHIVWATTTPHGEVFGE